MKKVNVMSTKEGGDQAAQSFVEGRRKKSTERAYKVG
jgi:hypothetical protein